MSNYMTVAEGDLYFADRFLSDDWFYSSPEDKAKALNEATVLIDQLNYRGQKTVLTQELQFPRGGDTEVPTAIKQACADIAINLLGEISIDQEARTHQNISSNIAGLHVRTDTSMIHVAFLHNIPSVTAWAKLKPYLRGARKIIVNKVS